MIPLDTDRGLYVIFIHNNALWLKWKRDSVLCTAQGLGGKA